MPRASSSVSLDRATRIISGESLYSYRLLTKDHRESTAHHSSPSSSSRGCRGVAGDVPHSSELESPKTADHPPPPHLSPCRARPIQKTLEVLPWRIKKVHQAIRPCILASIAPSTGNTGASSCTNSSTHQKTRVCARTTGREPSVISDRTYRRCGTAAYANLL